MQEGDKVLVYHVENPALKMEGIITRVWTDNIARVTVYRSREDGSQYFVNLDNVVFGSEIEGLPYIGEVLPVESHAKEGDD